MFDGTTTMTTMTTTDAAVEAWREHDWVKLHGEIRSVFTQRTVLKARQLQLLLEADETRLYKRFGYTSITAYVVGELGYTHHSANEQMRVAYELIELRGLAAEFREGALPWTSVRELTRVVTRKTEDVWLDAIEGKRSGPVLEMLRGKGKGALPTDPVDPKKLRYRIVFEDVSAEDFMLHKQARIAVAEANGGTCSDTELVRASAVAILTPSIDEPTKPPFQTAVTTCRDCKQAHLVGAGIEIALSPQDVERVGCDCEHIGDLERDEPTRIASAIPAPTRRKVFVRDKFRCTVPWCTATRFLAIHYIVHREHGGGHALPVLTLLCDGHHKQHHEGLVLISGQAPDALEFVLTSVPAGTEPEAGLRSRDSCELNEGLRAAGPSRRSR